MRLAAGSVLPFRRDSHDDEDLHRCRPSLSSLPQMERFYGSDGPAQSAWWNLSPHRAHRLGDVVIYRMKQIIIRFWLEGISN